MKYKRKIRSRFDKKNKNQTLHRTEQKKERVQKLLAQGGIGSRREIESWIKNQRIRINLSIAKLGDKASVKDKVYLDGKLVRIKEKQRTKIILSHKPAGFLCSRVKQGDKQTVFDLFKLPKNERWIMIGRLDFNTSGLLLFTNDGELANLLMHPSKQIVRSYAIRVFPKPTEKKIEKLRGGIMLDDGIAQFASFEEIENQNDEAVNYWYQADLTEGRYREIRRMFEAVNLTVSRLIRTKFGPFILPRNLSRGKWRFVESDELRDALKIIDFNQA